MSIEFLQGHFQHLAIELGRRERERPPPFGQSGQFVHLQGKPTVGAVGVHVPHHHRPLSPRPSALVQRARSQATRRQPLRKHLDGIGHLQRIADVESIVPRLAIVMKTKAVEKLIAGGRRAD